MSFSALPLARVVLRLKRKSREAVACHVIRSDGGMEWKALRVRLASAKLKRLAYVPVE